MVSIARGSHCGILAKAAGVDGRAGDRSPRDREVTVTDAQPRRAHVAGTILECSASPKPRALEDESRHGPYGALEGM